MTFLERSPVMLGLVAVVLVGAVTTGALLLQGGRFRSGYEVIAEFADAAGLLEGDHVLIAGVPAGKVRELRIAGDRLEAVLFIEGHELPNGTRASIILRTLVGRRSVELVPAGDWSAPLGDGDRIPLERTSIPIDVPDFADVSEELLTEVDTQTLNTFIVAVSDLMRGQRAQLQALIDGGSRLTRVVNDQEREVLALVERLRQVSEILASRDQELVRVIDDLGRTVEELARRRDHLQRLLRETNRSSAAAADLIESEKPEIDRILDEVHKLTGILSRNQMELAEAFAYAGEGVYGFGQLAYAGDAPVPWGDVFTTSLGPAGLDVFAGCGGLVDRQLDQLFGPDPRSCEEQENRTMPEDVQPRDAPQGAQVPPARMSGRHDRIPQRHELDELARRLLPARRDGGGAR